MTCREFERRAASLTLWELSQAQDQEILGHAGGCQKCAAWLQQQRMLAATMQTLRARTAGRAAGSDVERALLQAFRQGPFRPARPETVHPVAMRLSRFFEVGAYVAVAAAIVVGLFLGVRLLERRSVQMPAESQSAQPSASSPNATASNSGVGMQQQPAVSRKSVNRSRARHVRPTGQSVPDSTEPSQTGAADGDYVALMLCDPLSCSSDAQVVRMELPVPGISGSEQDAQMRIADVVVGYDGVVRAVRMVN